MAKLPGLPIYHGESETMESGGNVKPGDAVAFNGSGQLVPAKSGSNGATPYVGVAADTVDDDHEQGDMISVYTGGTIVTNVTSGVSAGDELAASSTGGQLKAGSTGGVAFSDAGGNYRGTMPSGYAAVRLGGVL